MLPLTPMAECAIQGRDIVLLYGPPWNDPTRVSKHHLAAYLARHNRVLYVESSLHALNLLARPAAALRLLARTRRTRQAQTNLWVRCFFNPLPYHGATALTSSRLTNALGQRYLALLLRRELAHLGMAAPLLIAGLPHAVDLVRGLSRSGLVYHCADEYRAVRGFPSSLRALETELVRMSDLVLVTAEALLEERRAVNPRTHWIPNGVEASHFALAQAAETPLAAEVRHVPRPVVGFVGALADWFDDGLLAHAAEALPGWSFVLVGPGGERMARLHARPNVYFLGPRPYASLPSLLKGFDVAVIPFRDNEVVKKADPIKAYEYLAAGLPVVTTDIPALRRFAGLIEVARDDATFVDALQRAAQDTSVERRERRMVEARRNSWDSRFAQLTRLIEVHVCAS